VDWRDAHHGPGRKGTPHGSGDLYCPSFAKSAHFGNLHSWTGDGHRRRSSSCRPLVGLERRLVSGDPASVGREGRRMDCPVRLAVALAAGCDPLCPQGPEGGRRVARAVRLVSQSAASTGFVLPGCPRLWHGASRGDGGQWLVRRLIRKISLDPAPNAVMLSPARASGSRLRTRRYRAAQSAGRGAWLKHLTMRRMIVVCRSSTFEPTNAPNEPSLN
jgi:hypothetical protein